MSDTRGNRGEGHGAEARSKAVTGSAEVRNDTGMRRTAETRRENAHGSCGGSEASSASVRRGEKPDRSIPFCNVILRCGHYDAPAARLPGGFRFAAYRSGMERDWARLEAEIGDFDSAAEAEAYFAEAYLSRPDELAARGVFVENAAGEVVGSCIAWRDDRRGAPVASLHWLVVGPKWQCCGLGRALTARTMEIFAQNGETPVYLHTQPWSWKAILLYMQLGFRLQRSDAFAAYENQTEQALRTLQAVLTPEQYAFVCAHCDD